MLVGLCLLYVGAVLTLNGLWLLGKINDKEIGVINVASGCITLCVALFFAFAPNANASSIKTSALTLLFSLTYFWVAYNRIAEVDGRGLGWFSLFVAITAIPICIQDLAAAHSIRELWLGPRLGSVVSRVVLVFFVTCREANNPASNGFAYVFTASVRFEFLRHRGNELPNFRSLVQ